MLNLQQIRWCCYIVRRNNDGPVAVAKVAEALEYAHNTMNRITRDTMLYLASLASGDESTWRSEERQLNDIIIGSLPINIEGHVDQLLEAWNSGKTDPYHFFWEFEAILPFSPKTTNYLGHILYNWCSHSLGRPLFAPVFGTKGSGV